jgi:non-heme chloroperoxidase
MGIVTTDDGTEIYYKDWGTGQPVVLSHGWPLNADSWEARMLFLRTRSRGGRVSDGSVGSGCESRPGSVA